MCALDGTMFDLERAEENLTYRLLSSMGKGMLVLGAGVFLLDAVPHGGWDRGPVRHPGHRTTSSRRARAIWPDAPVSAPNRLELSLLNDEGIDGTGND